MALNSSNSNAGSNQPGIGAGALSNFNTQGTENKSNGNFSGGDIKLDSSKLSINNHFNTNVPQQPTFNIDDVFTPTVSGNLDISKPKQDYWQAPPDLWRGPTAAQFGEETHYDYGTEPTMTVDEVYNKPKSNQPVVEKQGDYSASSNEKSNVKSSTFGNQDEISVTPTSVTENKGMIGNGAIQSVEGLDFHQKDKASQEVLDSKKKRDDAEAEDEADQMRNKLKGGIGKAAQQEGGEDFKIGTSEAENAFNKENAKKQAELQQKKKAADDAKNNASKVMQETDDELNLLNNKLEKLDKDIPQLESKLEEAQNKADNVEPILADLETQAKKLANMSKAEQAFNDFTMKNYELEKEINKLAKEYGIDIDTIDNDKSWFDTSGQSYIEKINAVVSGVREQNKTDIEKANKDLENANTERTQTNERLNEINTLRNEANDNQITLENEAKAAQKDYDNWKKGAEANLKAGTTPEPQPEPQPTPQSGAETSYNDAMNAIKNSADATPEQKAQAEEALTNLEESRQKLAEAAALARSGNPADMVAYQEALEEHNKRLEEAQKIGNRWTQTDFNKEFTRAVMDSKDFKVTLSDGTEMDFSDFMTEEVEKSPQYAKAMYDSKADQFEQQALEDEKNGNKVSAFINRIRAKIERWKSEWSQTMFGSKLTFADDKVREQFYQFTDTNMRATYATLNNVINDNTGKYSDEDKANALEDIEQAKALKASATALKASTGVLSGAGDDPSDGMFGTTNIKDLNEDQKMLANIKMFTQTVLGLGVSPAANEAYQTYYYLNRGDGSVFENDLDNDGFTWTEEYGNSAAAGLILSAGELGVGVVLLLNPASSASGINLIIDAVANANKSLFGVRDSVEKTKQMNNDILDYFKKAEDIAKESGNEEAIQEITNAITQIENFELKSDEVGNLDNWLEGSGSNTTSNEKFNQSLYYDEWMKLIEADPVMRDYAKSLAEKKKKDKDAKKDNADTGVNS